MSINRNHLGQAAAWIIAGFSSLPMTILAGCAAEERVVSSRGSLLGGQPGAVGGRDGQQARMTEERRRAAAVEHANNPMGYRIPSDYDQMTLRYSVQGEGERIVSRNPRELFFHIRRALIDGDREICCGRS